MSAYRSERARLDEETGNWWLLDEIMKAVRNSHQTTEEIVEAIHTALAKVIVQADSRRGTSNFSRDLWMELSSFSAELSAFDEKPRPLLPSGRGEFEPAEHRESRTPDSYQ